MDDRFSKCRIKSICNKDKGCSVIEIMHEWRRSAGILAEGFSDFFEDASITLSTYFISPWSLVIPTYVHTCQTCMWSLSRVWGFCVILSENAKWTPWHGSHWHIRKSCRSLTLTIHKPLSICPLKSHLPSVLPSELTRAVPWTHGDLVTAPHIRSNTDP